MPLENDALALGLQQHQAGHFEQAREIYRQALAADPHNPDVLNLLGAVCINLQQWDEAAGYLAEALRLHPAHFAALDNQGVLMAKQQRFAEATESFERALAISPQQAHTQLNLANALSRKGDLVGAIVAFQRAVMLAPDSLRAHTELAQALVQKNRFAEAVHHLREVVRLKPLDPKSHFELAAMLALCGQSDQAIASYRDVLRLKPDSAEACVNMANLYAQRQAIDEAVGWFHKAIALRPHFAEAYLNLGSALTKQEKFSEAKATLAEAIRLKPEMSEAYNNLGIVQAEEGDYAAAEANYRRALELKHDDADAMYNLGIALLKQQRIASALEEFDRSLELRPDHPETHHNRSAALLLSENFREGFAEYEWRFRSQDFAAFRTRWPRWDGVEYAGKTIVLCAEQGLGDSLQFVRYAPVLKRRGACVIVECPETLHPILARTPGVDAWISGTTPAPAADFCAPLMSLPHLLETTHATIQADVPYVFADPHLIEIWQERLAEWEGFKIGIVWQGNPKCPGDRFRSIPLAQFAPLAAAPGVRLVNLQKGPGYEQLAAVGEAWNVIDFGQSVDATSGAFMDTAAIMKNLDLVITSDTAAAHLAGALGVRVWLALPFVPDWRWLLDRDDSPWYPTMQLFRQSQSGDWPGVFEQMAGQLESLVAGGHGATAAKSD